MVENVTGTIVIIIIMKELNLLKFLGDIFLYWYKDETFPSLVCDKISLVFLN